MTMETVDQGREHAQRLTGQLTADNIRAIALTWVDNAGVTRVKAIPVDRLEHTVRWGAGMSPVFDVFCLDDSITTSAHVGGPTGDLRLYPDLDRLVELAAQPGWAWAPVSRLRQDGSEYPACQRSFVGRMAEAAARRKLTFRMAFEIEWIVGRAAPDGAFEPAATGPAYGMTRIVELSDYLRDILDALSRQDIPVEQVHPEYAPSQFELSVGATDPVTAADRAVLVRQTIRAVSQAYGLRASFAPVARPDLPGSGMHLHLSMWSGGKNLLAGGNGPHGMTERGEALLAGLLGRLPGLCAISCPSVASYLRLVPQRWAAPYQCWGLENREAALRVVTGTAGLEAHGANVELKCVDGSANPYLVVGAVMALTAGVESGARLPTEVTVDPATLPEQDRPPRLPQSSEQACEQLEADDVLCGALGEPLLRAFLAVRRAEIEMFADSSPYAIADASRWVY